jgi:hypothetical protein
MKLRTSLTAAFISLALAACGSSDTASESAASSETSASTVAELASTPETTTGPVTDSVDTTVSTAGGEAPPASLPADSETCKAIIKVRDLNEKSGASVSTFTAAILPVDGETRTPAEIEVSFDKFLRTFEEDSKKLLPELGDAYASLAKAQPQFKTDLVGIEKVTIGLLNTLTGMKGSDLERFDEIVATALPQDELIAAGKASLKIDTFARASCGVPFANT